MLIIKEHDCANIVVNGKTVAVALGYQNAIDTFEKISDIAYLWKRKTNAPASILSLKDSSCSGWSGSVLLLEQPVRIIPAARSR